MLRPFRIGIRKWIGFVQVRKNTDGVLLCAEVGKDPIEMFLHIEGTHLNLVTIEGHQVGFDTEGTGLIQTTTTATGAQFTKIGDVHLAQRVQIEII